MRRATGFTLIEVILVALIMAILAVSVTPQLTHTAQRLRAEHAAFEQMQWLRLAHERAVAEGQVIMWRWNEQTRRAVLEPDGPRSAAVPQGVSIDVEQDGSPVGCRCAKFFPSGMGDPVRIAVGPYAITVDAATSRVHLSGLPPR